ncbi:thiamine biosynthesis protein ThiF [Alkalihalobacillus alcalophilus ATCC 27647 = CGMCC 1.3604]|uniref:Thiamine biosynthesis protein ThiF n=1 Tax=Alkalihalobacillus alcalophilus ATCC 27647 = CGMCC 1.3604 TaxID=1218173 RepID=A0A094WHV4_ALKAL|nr:ThiF family adenylyltransferase [Alkalihalobacillus alcalophilus]KGA95488.1 thiamine biosynthesis protein ThiF [Alkalihalobacillus alcalophilus ATCC 27647 = CGMCC 1.3604]MED1564006.1 ThiF family adenylyltransferase [Alkalihalobacillus alcalophilus]THG88934.1 thiamine biosynthesis protein ThiF [Alkalihalobacillus alcalophilus ATCC 27647 = CGMCC 1.3604]
MAENKFERYSRQMLFPGIGEEGQEKLNNARVLIVGVGALGTVLANHLVRAGVGFVRIVDRDYVEKSNLQRQMLFDEEDVKSALPKAVAAKQRLEKVNSAVEIEAIVTDVNVTNIEEMMESIDLVFDGTDNFSTRFLLNDSCFKKGIPFVYGGAVSARGMSALFIPEETPCLRCFIQPGDGNGQTCDTIGVISPVVDIVSSFQVVEGLKYLVGQKDKLRNTLKTFDLWNNYDYEMKMTKKKETCPVCQHGEFPALEAQATDAVTTLCGRETVQIARNQRMDLAVWATRLEKAATVKKTPFLLQVQLIEGERLVIFPDGRILVQGTEDLIRAKSLYSKYIGD